MWSGFPCLEQEISLPLVLGPLEAGFEPIAGDAVCSYMLFFFFFEISSYMLFLHHICHCLSSRSLFLGWSFFFLGN